MIKLLRLYSETFLFEEVKFHNGINIIVGKYFGGKKKPDINGIGKSTLVRLIDYAFCGSSLKDELRKMKYSFLNEHNYSLELAINGVDYTIKRYFSDINKVYFGESGTLLESYEERDYKEIISNKIFLNSQPDLYFESSWFRNLMRFFIKDDLDHHDRSNPENFINPSSRYPYVVAHNFYLFGVSNYSIVKYDAKAQELRKNQNLKKDNLKKIYEDSGKQYKEYKADINEIENRIGVLETAIKEYHFLESFTQIENELLGLNKYRNELLYDYNKCKTEKDKYEDTFKYEVEISIDKVGKIYGDYNKIFGEYVVKSLSEIVEFRKKIAENRKKFLEERLKILEKEMSNKQKELGKVEVKRQKLFKILDEKEALDSIKNTYEKLIIEKENLEKKTGIIRKITELELTISKIQVDISECIYDIITVIDENQEVFKKLKNRFSDIVRITSFNLINFDEIVFDVIAQHSRKSPINIFLEIPKSQSLGRNRFRIMAYDLTVFFNIVFSKRDLPIFLIHDGVFNGIAERTLINTLNYIYNQSLINSDFQYIVTLNENDIYIPHDKESEYGGFEFDINDCIVASYGDSPEKMLFKRSF